ncbi:MAG: SRPBCC family protein [Sporichthyaceae bacterium]
MDLEHQFTIPVPIERAWELMLDVEALAPCVPGATLDEVRGREIDGQFRIKLGPLTLIYVGAATFTEIDEAGHRLVVQAAGNQTRGSGTADATVTAVLVPADGGTDITLTTDLALTGKAAQFTRGVLVDVSTKLLGQFVDCLAARIAAEPQPAEALPAEALPAEPPPVEPASAELAAHVEVAPSPRKPIGQPEPIEELDAVGPPGLKRLAPLAGVAVLALVLARRLRG